VVLAIEGTLPGITHRTPELGRIRLGEKKGNLPVKLKTFRLTSASRTTLEAAAAIYGGRVGPWEDAPDEGMWQLTTAVAELDVLIPGAAGAVTQSYELWKGGTCERRCDGVTERITGEPCMKPDPRLDQCDLCDVVTRFSVMLPRLPGLGVWRLDTGGWQAATTLPATLALLARMTRGEWIPAVLRAEQRSRKVRDPQTGKVQTNRFVVPVLDLPGATIGQLVEGAGLIVPPLLQLQEEPTAPQTAKEVVAAKRAQVEARVTPDAEDPPPPAPDEPRVVTGEVITDEPAEPVQCLSFDAEKGRCRKAAGHPNNHIGSEGSWKP